jgi:hypothetical protein
MLILFCHSISLFPPLCQPLLKQASKHLDTLNAETHGYWLDYGSLLGAVRDGGMVPWEFDLDLGVEEADCPKFQGLKEQMEAEGMFLYKTGDWVPGKAKSVGKESEVLEISTGISLPKEADSLDCISFWCGSPAGCLATMAFYTRPVLASSDQITLYLSALNSHLPVAPGELIF